MNMPVLSAARRFEPGKLRRKPDRPADHYDAGVQSGAEKATSID
jgi:hypothetical protein